MSRNFRIFFAVFVLLISVPAGAVPADFNAEKVYQEGVALYKKQEYSEAFLKFYGLEQTSPNYKDAAGYLRKIEEYLSFKEKRKMAEPENFSPATLSAQERRQRIEAILSRETEKETRGRKSPDLSSPAAPVVGVPGEGESVPSPIAKSAKEVANEKRLQARREKLQRDEARRARQELNTKIKKTYREAVACCRAGWYSQSRDDAALLREMFADPGADPGLVREMQKRLAALEKELNGQMADRHAFDRKLAQKEKSGKPPAVKAAGEKAQEDKKPDQALAQFPASVREPAGSEPTASVAQVLKNIPSAEGQPLSLADQVQQQKQAVPEEAENEKNLRRQEKILTRQNAREEQQIKKEQERLARQTERARQQLRKDEEQAAVRQKQTDARFNLPQQRFLKAQEAQVAESQEISRSDLARHRERIEEEKSQREKELLKGVDELYCDAVVFYAQGTYPKAQKLFEEVNRLWPDYKLSRSYLELIKRQLDTAGNPENPGPRLSLNHEQAVHQSLEAFEHGAGVP